MKFLTFPFFLLLSTIITGNAFALDPEPAPIKLGASLALSGKLAALGQANQRGLQMAIEELNSRGGVAGRRLLLVAENNEGEARVAVTGIMKLLNQDKVDLIYSVFTAITQAIKEQVVRAGKVMIYQASSPEISLAGDLIFRDYGDTKLSGELVAELLHQRKYDRVSTLFENGEFCKLVQDSYTDKANKLEIRSLSDQEFNPGESDFRPMLMRMKARAAQALVLCTWRDTQVVAKQLKELNMLGIPTFHFHAPFLPVSNTPEIKSILEENGAISTWYGFLESSATDLQKEFMRKYEALYGEKPILPEAVFAYDDVFVLAKALEGCLTQNSVDQGCVAKNLRSKTFDGVSGQITFNAERRSTRRVLAITVKEGAWREL